METTGLCDVYENISQRAAISYLRSLSPFTFVMPGGLDTKQYGDMEASQRDLHAFFQAFYEDLFQRPDRYGLPLDKDDSVKDDEPQRTERKQELSRKLKKPRESISRAIEFLMAAGSTGCLDGQNLDTNLDAYTIFTKRSKTGKKFINGWENIGLKVTETGGRVVLSSDRFPAMMPALQILTEHCLMYAEKNLGVFLFSRCDFRALEKGYAPGAADLYRIFNPADFVRIMQLHTFFVGMGYKPIYQIYGVFGWEVKYQGRRKVKSTPLFQVEYQDRCQQPLRLQIKCASTNRIANLIEKQPKLLQDDFNRRVFLCRGDECGWCKTRPHLGPSVLQYEGTQKSVCWYSNPDIHEFNDGAVELIRQYALLHEELQPAS